MAAKTLGLPTSAADMNGRPAAGNGNPNYRAVGYMSDLLVDEEGAVYYIDVNFHVVNRIDPSGVIEVVAGTGRAETRPQSPPANNDVAATGYAFNFQETSGPARLGRDAAGSIYVLEPAYLRVHKIGLNQRVTTLWSWGTGSSSNRALAVRGFTVAKDGTIYVGYADNREYNARTASVARFQAPPSGPFLGTPEIIMGVPGVISCPASGDADPGSHYMGFVYGVAVAPNGDLMLAQRCMAGLSDSSVPNGRVSGVRLSKLTGLTLPDIVPSADGTEVSIFRKGYHFETRDVFTGAVKRRFYYEGGAPAEVRATQVTSSTSRGVREIWENVNPADPELLQPSSALITRISRNSTTETEIVSPYGQKTRLTLQSAGDAIGYAASIDDDLTTASSYKPTHFGNGLLDKFVDIRNSLHDYDFDSYGRITSSKDHLGKAVTFAVLADTRTQRTFEMTDRDLEKTRYELTYDANGTAAFKVSFPNGKANTQWITKGDQTVSQEFWDGTKVTKTFQRDPLFGWAMPYASSTTVTSGSVTRTVSVTRTGSFQTAGQLFDVQDFSETVTTSTKVASAAPLTSTVRSSFSGAATQSTPANLWTYTNNGEVTTIALDELGRNKDVQAAGLAKLSTEYTRGQVTKSTLSGTRKTCSNDVGKTCAVDADCPEGTCETRTMVMGKELDAQGFVSKVTSGGVSTTYTRDNVGRVTGIRDPLGFDTNLTWDEEDHLVSYQAPGSPAHLFDYNEVDLLTTYTAPSTGNGPDVSSFAYSAGRRVTDATSADGQRIRKTYDANGNLDLVASTHSLFGEGYGSLDDTVESPNKRTIVSFPAADYGSGMDSNITLEEANSPAAGNYLSKWTFPDGFYGTVTKSPVATNSAQTLLNISVPIGGTTSDTTIVFESDASGRTRTFAADGSTGTIVRHTSAPYVGKVRAVVLGSIQSEHTYDELGNFASVRYGRATSGMPSSTSPITFDAEVYSERVLSRNAAGQITELVEVLDGNSFTYKYSYDAAGQLIHVTVNDIDAETYRYEANGSGNRACFGDWYDADCSQKAQYDSQNRLVRFGDTGYTYDRAGRLTAAGSSGYEYDHRGNLRRALTGGVDVAYEIDGRDRLVGRTARNGTEGPLLEKRRWLYQDQLEPVAEIQYDVENHVSAVKKFIYGTQRHVPDAMTVLAWPASGAGALVPTVTTYRIITNHLGTVRAVIDTTCASETTKPLRDCGFILETWAPNSFGRQSNPRYIQPFGFAGGIQDPHTGFVRFGARDYDPATGRWTARDPILFEGGQGNLYVYVGNDPVNWIDPDGRDGFTQCLRQCVSESTPLPLWCVFTVSGLVGTACAVAPEGCPAIVGTTRNVLTGAGAGIALGCAMKCGGKELGNWYGKNGAAGGPSPVPVAPGG